MSHTPWTVGPCRDHGDPDEGGHTTDGGRVYGVTRYTYAECADYGCPTVVVIDPAALKRPIEGGETQYGAAQLARTLRLLADHDQGGPYTYRAEIVRELADVVESLVAPPKPEEPTGWLAAVEDVDGNRWCLHGGPVEPGLEWYSPDLNVRRRYADIAAVRVLSEGVQS